MTRWRTVRPLSEQEKCELAGDPHSLKRPAAKAFQVATWGRTATLAERLHLSQRLVESWGNPNDPQRGPLQILEIVMRTALDDAAPDEDALAPLRYLASRFGRIVVKPQEITPAGVLVAADQVCARVLREAGGAVDRLIAALADGRVSESERETNRKELGELHGAVVAAIEFNERAVRDGKLVKVER